MNYKKKQQQCSLFNKSNVVCLVCLIKKICNKQDIINILF